MWLGEWNGKQNAALIHATLFARQQNMKNSSVGQNSPLKWNFVTSKSILNFDSEPCNTWHYVTFHLFTACPRIRNAQLGPASFMSSSYARCFEYI